LLASHSLLLASHNCRLRALLRLQAPHPLLLLKIHRHLRRLLLRLPPGGHAHQGTLH
jgi:hypothetical protein